jgi:AcrR family transcriptional regulator
MEKANSKSAIKLGRQDWVNAAIGILKEKGIDAVKVDVLAKSLEITRGSFYWHFKNLDDLLEVIIQEWKMSMTEDVMQTVETSTTEPSQKLLQLFEIAAKDDDRFEQAMRVWGVHNARTAAAIVQVDQRRLDYLQQLFLQLGFAPTEAALRAQIAYSMRLGWFIIAMPKDTQKRLTESHLLHQILTRH